MAAASAAAGICTSLSNVPFHPETQSARRLQVTEAGRRHHHPSGSPDRCKCPRFSVDGALRPRAGSALRSSMPAARTTTPAGYQARPPPCLAQAARALFAVSVHDSRRRSRPRVRRSRVRRSAPPSLPSLVIWFTASALPKCRRGRSGTGYPASARAPES